MEMPQGAQIMLPRKTQYVTIYSFFLDILVLLVVITFISSGEHFKFITPICTERRKIQRTIVNGLHQNLNGCQVRNSACLGTHTINPSKAKAHLKHRYSTFKFNSYVKKNTILVNYTLGSNKCLP
jgi:hypothetical protein